TLTEVCEGGKVWDRRMFHTEEASSFELALETIAAARSNPSLAVAIRRSTRRPEGAGWVVEFLRYPRWQRLCEDLRIDEDRCDIASLDAHATAMRTAVLSGNHEAAFWNRLTADVSTRNAAEESAYPLLKFDDVMLSEIAAWDGPPQPSTLSEH